jgi:hypothetical protein
MPAFRAPAPDHNKRLRHSSRVARWRMQAICSSPESDGGGLSVGSGKFQGIVRTASSLLSSPSALTSFTTSYGWQRNRVTPRRSFPEIRSGATAMNRRLPVDQPHFDPVSRSRNSRMTTSDFIATLKDDPEVRTAWTAGTLTSAYSPCRDNSKEQTWPAPQPGIVRQP